MATELELKEEDRKIRLLRRMMDLTCLLLIEEDLTVEEASRHVSGMREFALRLFPGKGEVFDMVYGPRLKRIMSDRFRLS